MQDSPGYQGGDLLQFGGRGRGVRGAPADGSVRPCGSGPGSLPVRGLPARGATRPRGRVQLERGPLSHGPGGTGGRGFTFLQARDQLRSFAATPMKLTRGTLSSVARVRVG